MGKSIYEEMFGLKPVINACGTQTTYGGSLLPRVAVEAMNEAARHFVDVRKLIARVGEEIAELCGVEAAYVTSGAGAGLVLAAAACMTGTDREKMGRLPDTEGMRNEIIVQKGNVNSFTRLFRNAGAKLVEVGGSKILLRGHGPRLRALGVLPEDIEDAINEKTCAVGHFISFHSMQFGTVPLEQVIDIAHGHSLPVIVDAAAQNPPFERLHLYTDMGADLVSFSGGKDLRGPNDTGILVGRKELIEACAMQANPSMGIGRPFKVSKEDLVGLLVALRWYKDWRDESVVKQKMAQAEYVMEAFEGFAHVKAYLMFPDETEKPDPMVQLVLDEAALGITARELANILREGDPPIALRPHYAEVGIAMVNPQYLEDGEEGIVCDAIKRVLRGSRG
jgi:L-seryl-tRNA(Ser) seleniumtransferase